MTAQQFKLNSEEQQKIEETGKKYNLRFIILHGSYAKGLQHKDSDLDIAVLGHQYLTFDMLLVLFGPLGNIFGDNHERELDVKSLHGADPLFRYFVVRDGVLLYGDETDFNEFKAYTIHAFEDAQKLFQLEEVLVKKHNKYLLTLSRRHA